MAALGDDCYFFCTSTCVKGSACPFRHVEAAKNCRIICQHWQMGGCMRPLCKFRHSDFAIQLDTSEIPCYWEALPTGCVRKNCLYKHSKPKSQDDGITTAASAATLDNTTVGATSTKNEVITSQNFVQPVVTPVIIQPSVESEESNSSPMKVPPPQEVTQESQTITTKQSIEHDKSESNNVNNNSNSPQKQKVKTIKKKNNKITQVANKIKQSLAVQKKGHNKSVEKVVGKIKAKAKKIVEQPRKSIKDRLGKIPLHKQAVSSSSEEEETDSESSSDSDDSIENIKVMSMEEILRQKALESMMKKRVVEDKTSTNKRSSLTSIGKKSLSAVGKKSLSAIERNKTLSTVEKKRALSAVERKRPLSGVERTTYQPTLAKKRPSAEWKVPASEKKFEKHNTVSKNRHVTAQVKSSSSSSEEESSDEEDTTKQSSEESSDEEDTTKQSSEESSADLSDTASSGSSSDSEDDSNDSEDLDVRRVVVDLKSEKAARKKAKESFLKKQRQNAINAQDNRNKRQNIINAQDNRNRGQVIRPSNRNVNHMPLGTLNKVENRDKQQRKRQINIDYDSDDIVSSRVRQPLKLNVQDRLGKSTALHKTSSDPRMLSRAEKFGSFLTSSKSVVTKKGDASHVKVLKMSKSSSSDEDHDPLAEIKVKTLEEIRLEKMRKLTAEDNRKQATDIHKPLPVKQRLGNILDDKQNKEVENMKGRQVVLMNDTGSKSDDASNMKPLDEQKKARKRPWRSQRRIIEQSTVEPISVDDDRTAVIALRTTDGDNDRTQSNSDKEEHGVDESPFERLRRKALMKKLQTKEARKLKMPSSMDEVNTDEAGLKTTEKSQAVEQEDNAVSKEHKHKHSHKHHKRVKIERQIYMPPAMKNTVTLSEHDNSSSKGDLPSKEKVSPQKREPHPIAAAWAAGLSLSSKGLAARRPETAAVEHSGVTSKLEIGKRLGVREMTSKPKEIMSSRLEIGDRLGVRETATKPKEIMSSRLEIGERSRVREISSKPKEIIPANKISQPSEPSSGVTIKSFSEIMAEKRKRRLELQAQKSGTTDLPVSTAQSISASTLPSSTATSMPATLNESNSTYNREVDSKPRVPITHTPDNTSDTGIKAMRYPVSTTTSSLKPTVLSTISVAQKESLDISSCGSSSNVPRVPTLTASSLTPHSTAISTDQNVKLKAGKNKKMGDKKKKGNKLNKKNLKEQINQRNIVTSTDRNSNVASLVHSHVTPFIPSQSSTSDLQQTLSNKTSNNVAFTRPTLSDSKVSSPQPSQHKTASTHGLGLSDKPSVSKFSSNTDTSSVKSQPASTSKHSISAQKIDSEPTTKRARASLEDEFNFFEDEDLGIDEDIISENLQPIDDLLQDIDDLLS